MKNDDYEKKIKTFREWFNHDIGKALENECQFLAVMGMCAFLEYFGSLLRGNPNRGGNEENFNASLNRLGPDYKKLVDKYKGKGVSIYSRVRCGLMHEQFIKGSATVFCLKEPDGITCGIIVDMTTPENRITIYPMVLFKDIVRVRDEFIREMETSTEKKDDFMRTWRARGKVEFSGTDTYDVIQATNVSHND